jgi:LCP family protein required for cell wall assembly
VALTGRTLVVGRALVAAVSLLVVVGGGVAWAQFKSFTASIPHCTGAPGLDAGEADPDGAATNILLIGSDTRSGATKAELKALHTGTDTSTVNADTMMVVHVPSGGGKPTLVSFPRDSWVSIPGHGKAKMNAAYPDAYNDARSAGKSEQAAECAGMGLAASTIHTLTGLHIDHYMQVSLLGFYRISNAIGGVTVCLNAAQNKTTDRDAYGSGYSGIDLPKGVSVIKGKQALAFVRQRHGLPNGDLDRIKRQQYFLKSTFQKVTSAGTLLNPFKIRNLLKAIGPSLLTDPSLNLFDLARQFESLASGNLTFATIPNNGSKTIYPDGVETSIVQVDTAAIPAFIDSLEGKGSDALAKATAASPSSVTVDVLNGAGVTLLASRNAAQLKKLGFAVDVVDSTSTTPTTSVEYPAGKESAAKAVLAVVPKAKAVQTADVTRVTIVLGTDGRQVKGLNAPAAPKATGTTAAAGKADPTHGLGCIN